MWPLKTVIFHTALLHNNIFLITFTDKNPYGSPVLVVKRNDTYRQLENGKKENTSLFPPTHPDFFYSSLSTFYPTLPFTFPPFGSTPNFLCRHLSASGKTSGFHDHATILLTTSYFTLIYFPCTAN